jgi:hypothetical protein
LISRRNHDLSIFSTAVIYPVVKVHRRSGSRAEQALSLPAVRWSVGSQVERTDQRMLPDPDTRRRLEDQPANRRTCRVGGTRRSSRGWTRAIRFRYLRTVTRGIPPPGQGGGDEETRTPDPLLAKEMLFQLSYVPVLVGGAGVVGVSGLEPETSALSGQCSNQLS